MTTRDIIYLALRIAYSGFILANVSYTVWIGARYGFRFPRSLHVTAAVILLLELVLLVLVPLPLDAISTALGSVLALLPVSPYVGWVVAGGPQRLHERLDRRPTSPFNEATAPSVLPSDSGTRSKPQSVN